MSEKLRPNFTPIPNVILDEMMRMIAPGATKVLFAICRFTYGWGKQADRISLSQLQEITGMARGSVVRSVKELGDILTVTPGEPRRQQASEYRLNIEISDKDLVSLRDQTQSHKETRLVSEASLIKRPSKDIPKKKNPSVFSSTVENVIRRLNELTGQCYRPGSKATKKHVGARIAEGFSEADLLVVVEDRCRRWLDDPKMREYLRPSTLFNSDKFESYLQAAGNLSANGAGHTVKDLGDGWVEYSGRKMKRADYERRFTTATQ